MTDNDRQNSTDETEGRDSNPEPAQAEQPGDQVSTPPDSTGSADDVIIIK